MNFGDTQNTLWLQEGSLWLTQDDPITSSYNFMILFHFCVPHNTHTFEHVVSIIFL